MVHDFAQAMFYGVILFGLSLFEGMLIVGLGSVRYYANMVGVSENAVAQFNKELPSWLRVIYGFTGKSIEDASNQATLAMIIWGGKFPILFALVGTYELLSQIGKKNVGAAGAWALCVKMNETTLLKKLV